MTNTNKILYSAFKNAIAPSWILAAILAILGVPSEWALICLVFHQVKASAKTPKAGIIRTRLSIFI
jgi:hypothetical protein